MFTYLLFLFTVLSASSLLFLSFLHFLFIFFSFSLLFLFFSRLSRVALAHFAHPLDLLTYPWSPTALEVLVVEEGSSGFGYIVRRDGGLKALSHDEER